MECSTKSIGGAVSFELALAWGLTALIDIGVDDVVLCSRSGELHVLIA